jgi:hypothetical protein
MVPKVTGLPGIASKSCPDCDSSYLANFLESGEDLLEVPDEFTFLPF